MKRKGSRLSLRYVPKCRMSPLPLNIAPITIYLGIRHNKFDIESIYQRMELNEVVLKWVVAALHQRLGRLADFGGKRKKTRTRTLKRSHPSCHQQGDERNRGGQQVDVKHLVVLGGFVLLSLQVARREERMLNLLLSGSSEALNHFHSVLPHLNPDPTRGL